ncbi:MAG TPA: tetratricopeptide repeat protein [bacterium]|nr:tetratricopeptide repeat protein [bacterium]
MGAWPVRQAWRRPLWLQVRRWLIAACALALPLVAIRAVEVAGDVRRDRRAASALARGVQLQLEGRYDEAAAALHDAIAISPRAFAAYAALGEVEFRRHRYDEAIAAYRRLMAHYPYTYQADLHREVGLIELRAGRPGRALRSLTQAVELDGADWLAFYLLGHAHLRVGQADRAAAAWRRVVELNPSFRPAREHLERLRAPAP